MITKDGIVEVITKDGIVEVITNDGIVEVITKDGIVEVITKDGIVEVITILGILLHLMFRSSSSLLVALVASSHCSLVPALRLSMAIMDGTIIGAGRIGNMLFESNAKKDALVSRDDSFSTKLAPSGPIYISTRNKDLEEIIAATPKARLPDLVFLQNGILTDYLAGKGLQDNTQALLYVAVAKKGEAPIDGPEGYTSVTGKWAQDFKVLL